MKYRCALAIVLALAGCGEPGAKPAEVQLFNGKDTTGWKLEGRVARNHWRIGTAAIDPKDATKLIVNEGGGELVNAGIVGADLASEQHFGDARITLEFMIPRGSAKVPANSGVFLMGEYELQIMDDPSTDAAHPGDMDQGAVVRTIPPKVLATKPAGEWQKYEIEFRAPRFDAAGQRTQNARLIKVTLNGEVIHQNVVLPGPTPGGITGQEHATGPLVLQGSEGPVACRNIVVTPKN